jgi:hypothetical protein
MVVTFAPVPASRIGVALKLEGSANEELDRRPCEGVEVLMRSLVDTDGRVDATRGDAMRRLIVLLVAAAMFTVGCSSSDPTTSDEYAALEQELAQTTQDLAEAEALLAETAAEHDEAVALSETIAEVEANETANIEAFLSKDLDALMDTFTDDVVFVDETYGDYVEGKDAYTKMNAIVMEFTDPEETEVLDHFISEDGARAASTWEWVGINYWGNPFSLPHSIINEYRDGKIARQTIYYASPDAYSQLMGQ